MSLYLRSFFYILTALLLANCGPGYNSSSELEGDLVLADDEVLLGDMIVKKHMVSGFEDEANSDEGADFSASGLSLSTNKLWKDGKIPIQFASDIASGRRNEFMSDCKQLAKYADVECVLRKKESDFVRVVQKDNNYSYCGYSYYGRQGGKQILTIRKNCWYNKGTIRHELMHVLGVSHEHDRPDRDRHVDVYYENMEEVWKQWYSPLKDVSIRTNTSYDTKSIMHYSSYNGSKNGLPTMLTKSGGKIYWRSSLSHMDHVLLYKLYGGTDPRK